jgi:hypothetical protein
MKSRTPKAIALAAALLVVAAAGCTDPTVAPKSTVTGANIFADPAAYQQFIARIYAGLIVTGQRGPDGNADIQNIDEGFSEYLRLYWYLQEMPTDEAAIGWGDPGLPDLNTGLWAASNQMVNAMYYRVYFQVMLANEFLRQTTDALLDSRGVSATLKTQIHQYRAEARFLRALSYWHGIDLFGNIPLVTEADPVGSIPPAQSTRTAIYDYVVSELTAVKDSLPAAGAATYGRASPAAAHMLLAEVYLNAGVYTGTTHYDLALTEASNVIGTAGLSLNPVFQNNFTSDNNLSPELIFAAAQDGTHTQTWGGMTFLVHAGCGGSMMASWFGMDYCWGGYRLKQQAYHLFSAGDSRGAFIYDSAAAVASTRARRTQDSITIGSDTIGAGKSKWTSIDSTSSNTVSDIGTFNHGAAAPKFTNKTSTGATLSQIGMISTDFPIFRLAEAYLIYAEAQVRGGGGGSALTYLNALRQRAYGNATHNFATVPPLDTILAERGRELLFEARRRTDLIRFGKFVDASYLWAFKGGTAGGTALAAGRDLYPLPANELIANPNLTQNPGY